MTFYAAEIDLYRKLAQERATVKVVPIEATEPGEATA
jgi:hypothetical protein